MPVFLYIFKKNLSFYKIKKLLTFNFKMKLVSQREDTHTLVGIIIYTFIRIIILQ